jgi:hypothetical protein
MQTGANQSDTFEGAIPLEWVNSDLYEVLQVSPKAEIEIIEAAYKRLALKYHPEKNPTPEAHQRMQQINTAYAVLHDPARRHEYDLFRLTPFVTAPPEYGAADSGSDSDRPDKESVNPDRQQERVSAYDWDSLAYHPPRRTLNGWMRNLCYALVAVILGALLIMAISAFNSPPVLRETSASQTPVQKLPPGVLFSDDFDSVGAANWILDTPWHLTQRLAASGKYSLWMGDEEQSRYTPGLNSSATLVRPLDLTGASNPRLIFDLMGQTDSPSRPAGQDKLLVEVATPGQDFVLVKSIGGMYTSWESLQIDLSKWNGKLIQIRLRFISGAGNVVNNFGGFLVDNFRIEK